MDNVQTTVEKSFWMLIEGKIHELGDSEFSGSGENAVKKIALEIDSSGLNVSLNGGRMIQLRTAVRERIRVGRPLLKDITDAINALALEDIADAYAAMMGVTGKVGQTFPDFRQSAYRPDVLAMVEKKKLDLQVAKAKSLDGDSGIRYLIGEGIEDEIIIDSLGINDEKLAEVKTAIAAELAEKRRIEKLLEAVGDKSDDEKVKHLIDNDVADEQIVKIGGFGRDIIDNVKKAMEEELKEKQRLADEEAARKKAEAEGPPLEDIPADQMLEYIETINDILDMTEVEAEVRQMCEQSSIPKCLIDVAVTDRGKLEELEKQAEDAS